jgi:hypothetical protein
LIRELPPSEWRYTRIGALRGEAGVAVLRGGAVIDFSHCGFDHFA